LINDHAQGFFFWVTLLSTAALMMCYLWVGDRTWWSACVVVWPSLLWCLILVPMTLFCLNIRRPRLILILLAAVSLFLLATMEWRSLVRSEKAEERARFSDIRREMASESTALRVAIWNVAGHMSEKSDVLATLNEFAPDVCFLQETGVGFLSGDLVGRWRKSHWINAGDCGVLSRFPIRHVGAGDDLNAGTQQFIEFELPGGDRFLAANVHLMMPPIAWNIVFSDDHVPYREGHVKRTSQYGLLMRRIESHLAESATETVILAGDFNVGADMQSLDPVRERLKDVWLAHGVGWGATAFSSFPVARIDHCWVSESIEPVSARVISTKVSDHRILLVDLIIPTAASGEPP